MIEERNWTEGLRGVLLGYLVVLSMLFMPVTLNAEATWLAGDHHITATTVWAGMNRIRPSRLSAAMRFTPLKRTRRWRVNLGCLGWWLQTTGTKP